MDKDPGRKTAIIALIVSIFGIILTLSKEIDINTLIFLFVLTISAIVLTFLSFYLKETKENSEEIKKMKENFKITERLNKLELKVFKK